MKTSIRLLSCAAFALAAFAAQAQDLKHVEAHNLVQLSASASQDVAQDWLTLSMTTSRDGADPEADEQSRRDVAAAQLAKIAAMLG